MNEDKNREDSRVETGDQIANMSRLDFLLLLWEARIVGEDYVEAKANSSGNKLGSENSIPLSKVNEPYFFRKRFISRK